MRKIFRASLEGGKPVFASMSQQERDEAAAVIRERMAALIPFQADSVTGVTSDVQSFNYARLNQVMFSNATTVNPDGGFSSWSVSDASKDEETKDN